MSSEFDPARAWREELIGLKEIETAIRERERVCEEAMAKAEMELNAIRKLRGFARIQIEQIKNKIRALEPER
jgi:hypothetical protein